MPASTRSSTKQSKLEDVGAGATEGANSKVAKGTAQATGAATTTGRKRKADATPKATGKKSSKLAKTSPDKDTDDRDVVVINRAPVLELWASCVTQFMYPSLSWNICLSAGGAVSTIAAISKGRSIGTMEKPDAGEAQENREKREEKAEKEEMDEVNVMSFHLRLKDGQAMVGDKPKKGNEEALVKKYGGVEPYDKVRQALQESLQKWKGKEEELDRRAFHMYEDFRPSVMPGQAGWGRKGQLRLDTIREVVGEVS